MMKSGMGIGEVYINTPSRIAAVAFVVSLATMICKTMDLLLKRTKPPGERKATVKALEGIHCNTFVKYDRAHDRLTVLGPPGMTSDFFKYLGRLDIRPEYLLGHQ